MSNNTCAVQSIEWFEKNRPEHYQFVRDKIEKCKRHAIISMGVKVGKKEVVLIQSRRTASHPQKVRHVFITNFKRNDCREQREQLACYGIDTFYCDELELSVPHIKGLIRDGMEVIVHVDESDYGAGAKQQMATTFRAIRAIKDYAYLRLYSATNEEAVYSEFADEADLLEMPDPPSFFGPDDYLDANLVEEAEPFWDGAKSQLTPQAEAACRYWIEQTTKPFAILRIATSHTKDDDGVTYRKLKTSHEFTGQLAMYGISTYFVDGDNGFYWGKAGGSSGGNSWELLDKKSRILIVINQTCVRSTEIGFHPLIAFLHDYRKTNAAYNTVSQAQGRIVHYPYTPHDRYWPDPSVAIRVYGCVSTFMLAAKRITADDYVRLSGRKLAARVDYHDESLSLDPEHYHEYHSTSEEEIWKLAKRHGFDTPNATWTVQDREYVSTIRSVTKRWTKAEIDSERFYGLEKHKRTRRSLAYYHPDGTVGFRLLVHDGVTQQARSKTNRSQYNITAA